MYYKVSPVDRRIYKYAQVIRVWGLNSLVSDGDVYIIILYSEVLWHTSDGENAKLYLTNRNKKITDECINIIFGEKANSHGVGTYIILCAGV